MKKHIDKVVSHLKKMKLPEFLKKINRNTIFVGVAVIAVVIIGVLFFNKSNISFEIPSIFGKSDSQIGKLAVDYINNNQLSQTPATLVSTSEASGLVKIKIKIGTQEFDSYASKDGKFLFPQAFDMTPKKDVAAAPAENNPAPEQNNEPVVKNDKPMLEAFVVARCPYGIQMQRAMADAVSNSPSLAQYIKARYIGSVSGNTITAMHGEAEAAENLRQICIREEQASKYWAYVGCQMKASGTEVSCAQSTGIDSAKLSACISSPQRGVAYAKEDFDLAAKYGVQGSPTLILNGATISENGFGGRSSDGVRAMACSGFNSPASFCSTKLNTAAAAVSFSATYSAASGSGTAAAGAGCQAAQ
ncbi:MAG: hypothetical protein NTW11_02360 [Candidatus Staskawiczbacteria bacterium]|nr:hypothetical protein [Candidatus Staskawiczbacteria bacterium]